MSFHSLLNESCTVRIATVSTDTTTGYGGAVSYTDTPSVPCNIQQASTSEAVEFGKRTGRTTYTGFFAYGTGPQAPKDRVTWRNRSLECVGYPKDPAGDLHHEETTLAEPVNV